MSNLEYRILKIMEAKKAVESNFIFGHCIGYFKIFKHKIYGIFRSVLLITTAYI